MFDYIVTHRNDGCHMVTEKLIFSGSAGWGVWHSICPGTRQEVHRPLSGLCA